MIPSSATRDHSSVDISPRTAARRHGWSPAALLGALFIGLACSGSPDADGNAGDGEASGPSVSITQPVNGARIGGTFMLTMEVSGLDIVPAKVTKLAQITG